MKHYVIIVVSVIVVAVAIIGIRLIGEQAIEPEIRTRSISLFYYDAARDTDTSGNIICSAQGLVAVPRTIPLTTTPIQDAVRLLLRGELTDTERSRGISTEYPLSGFSLVAASLRDGVLTLTFADPQNKSGGGSCRVAILWAQIRATAMQFDGVREVRFAPEELFQP